MIEPPLFVLDEPQIHHVTQPGVWRFRGAALAIDGPRIETLTLIANGRVLAETSVNLHCPELEWAPFPGATHCRFEVDAEAAPGETIEIRARSSDGETPVFFFDAPREPERMRAFAAAVLSMPVPTPGLVMTTQGGEDVESYRQSAISGYIGMESLLRASGCAPESIRSVLDIGCGTGRLLLGWHASDPARRLTGVDINRDLIAWNQQELAGVGEWHVSQVVPPLPFADASFDLIQLASVFTHLPLSHQKSWLLELKRLLRPEGALLITLHGSIYSRLLLDGGHRELLERTGHVEIAAAEPGANAFATYHTADFARELFGAFPVQHWFPRGNFAERPSLFPIAALQDVWILRPGSGPASLRVSA